MQGSSTTATKKTPRLSIDVARRDTEESIIPVAPEIDLKEEFSCMLSVSKEKEQTNSVLYNIHKREYRPITSFDYSIMLIEGSIDYRPTEQDLPNEGDDGVTHVPSDQAIPDDQPAQQKPKLVRNSFNFRSVGTQTLQNLPIHRSMETQQPDTGTLSGHCSAGNIFDAYMNKNENKTKNEKEVANKTSHPAVNRLAEITERMIVQNVFNHLLEDFKYYEDPADEFRGNFGCLLPLWKFAPEETRDLSVTSICWIPGYSDLFAVSFGSFSITNQREGEIMLFSLKNPSHPIKSLRTECGVMCIDINKDYSNYLCAAFYDGSVAVYDIHTGELDRKSNVGAHSMYVAQVQWNKVIKDEQLSFYSISPDGVVIKWDLVKNGLKPSVLITLDILERSIEETNNLSACFGSGITLDFHSSKSDIYLVGTQMGHGHLCLKTYSSEPLQTFSAHDLSVYKIAWNKFHPKIFITCSDDWTVKIWVFEDKIVTPLFDYDLGSQVYDVEWAPFSSTVFAAVTANGEVFVYDLAIDKKEPLCEQVVLFWKGSKALRVSFNRLNPIILVGDDKGEVTCLKLSPNLRKESKNCPESSDEKARQEFELSKFDAILATFR